MNSTRSAIRVVMLALVPVMAWAAMRGRAGVAAAAPSVAHANAAMVQAAERFLASLQPAQRAKAVFAFDDGERTNWHFVPRPRRGLPLGEMTAQQQQLARAVLQAALSRRGYLAASTVIDLELVLREMGENPAVRDPGLYFFSIFGTPSSATPWGFRAEGHHLSLNFTLVSDSLVSTTPAFFGANPAEVRRGARQGLRVLKDEEDVARELVLSLDRQQMEAALIAARAPADIVTGSAARVDPLSPVGIRVSALREEQAMLLERLLEVYLGRMAEPLAAQRRAALERAGAGNIAFAWAGSTQRGDAHYYRIQGPTFLIEYDNTQSNANHIHTVWRDFAGDFGRDLLRDHYRDAPHRH